MSEREWFYAEDDLWFDIAQRIAIDILRREYAVPRFTGYRVRDIGTFEPRFPGFDIAAATHNEYD